MGLADLIVVAVIAGIVGFAAWYLYKSVKRGKKCVGCPDGCVCAARNSEGCCCRRAETPK